MGFFITMIKNDLSVLKGIGPKRLNILKENNINNLEDLLNFFPVRYEDKSRISDFKSAENEPVTIKASILRKGSIRYMGPGKSQLYIPIVDDKGNKGELIFFNQPYLINQFKKDDWFYFYGRVTKTHNKFQMFAPKFSNIKNAENFLKITPIYKNIDNIPNSLISTLINQVLEKFKIKDFISQDYLNPEYLISLSQMYKYLHFPQTNVQIKEAIKRMKFNEGLKINTGIYSNSSLMNRPDFIIENFESVEPFIRQLPFDLTNSQEQVIRDIFQDLKSDKIMNRMIEGDVGSGKTIIAVICAYLFALNGFQTAYMAPTEILAQQHFKTFKEFLSPFDISVKLITGSMNSKETEKIRSDLEEGKIQVIIGTHSLIQENTQFYNLGLIITDEQHRFGVKQRGMFQQKGTPHTLVMSATPIPRSLALTLYGDLDCSVISQLPKGRKRVKTYFFTSKKLKDILKFIEKEINKGHQAFVVCPFVEDSEEMKEVISVDKASKVLKKFYKDRIRIEALHGKMDSDSKKNIIKSFNEGNIDLLIATSIIEVGIDVPNVSTIAILSADRFGLSQLHQLRGRTGRSDIQSYCFLVSDNLNELTVERMKVIVNNHDGHEIALADLKLRGPGDYFGLKQHGYGSIKFIDPLKDRELLEYSKKVTERIFSSTKKQDMIAKDYLLKSFQKETELISMN